MSGKNLKLDTCCKNYTQIASTNYYSPITPVRDLDALETTVDVSPYKRCRQEYTITMATSAQLKRHKQEAPVAFDIVQLLLDICGYCDIFDIIGFRTINSNFNRQLSFSFECQYYQVFFKYSENRALSNIVRYQICDNLSSLCKWYLMSRNCRVSRMLLLPDLSQDWQQQQTIENSNDKTNEGKIDLFRIKLNCLGIFSSDVKDVKQKALSNDWDDKQGQLAITPLQQLFTQLKSIDKCIKSNNWESNDCKQIPDWFILAEMFGIKPLTNKLLQLIENNESFRNFLKYSKFNESLESTMSRRYEDNYTNCTLSFFWELLSRLNVGKQTIERMYFGCFSKINHVYLSHEHAKGKYAFFADLACRGNFVYYKKFMDYHMHKSENESQLILSDCYQLRHGILVMFGAFLNINLLKQFSCISDIDQGAAAARNHIRILPRSRLPLIPRHTHENESIDCGQMMMYVLNPLQLESFKNCLTSPRISLIDITNINITGKQNDDAFDIFGNINYHPIRRLEFMWQLCFSTRFARELFHYKTYHDWRKWVIESYSNFDYFVKFWCLNKYSYLKNNKRKQENIHFQFKLIMQYLLGLSSFYKDIEQNLNTTNVLEDFNEHLFINIKPKNELEVSLLYDVMLQSHTKEDLLASLKHPQIDRKFCRRPRLVFDKDMQFDAVYDVCQFMKDVFNLFG